MSKLFALIGVLILVFAFADTASATGLSKPPNNLGLIGYWSYDSGDIDPNIRDTSGQGNHGRLILGTGGSTATTTARGKVGGSLDLDGNDDHVENGTVNFNNNNVFSVSFWFYPQDGGSTQYIVDARNESTPDAGEATTIAFDQTGNDELSYAIIGSSWRNGSISLDLNEWHHVLVIHDSGANTFQSYIDGELDIDVSSGMEDFTLSGANMQVGARNSTDSAVYEGRIDELRIYNRAVSSDEIDDLSTFGLAVVGGSSPDNLVAKENLIGHWTFDGKDTAWTSETAGTVADVSPSGNTGTLNNMNRSKSPAHGKIGQALEFDGSDDYVDAGDNNIGEGGAQLTISAWFKGSFSTGALDSIVTKYEGSTTDTAYYLVAYDDDSDGTPQLRAFVNDTDDSAGTFDTLQGNVDISADEWHHGVFVYNSGEMDLYLNGETSGSKTASISGNIKNSTEPLIIGARNNGSENYWDGSIDDVRIYDTALTAGQIKQIYENTRGDRISKTLTPSGLQDGLVGHWTFDGPDMRPNVRDVSGQGNHGQLSGQTSTTTAIGKLGQALEFDGVDDYVAADTSGNVLSELSLSFWIYEEADTSGLSIFSRGISSDSGRWFFETITGGRVRFIKDFSDTDLSARFLINYPLNQWNHMVLIWPGGNSKSDVVVYVNGTAYSPDGTGGDGVGDVVSDSGLTYYLGALGSQSHFNGRLDDVRVYNRALSASKVKRLYELGR